MKDPKSKIQNCGLRQRLQNGAMATGGLTLVRLALAWSSERRLVSTMRATLIALLAMADVAASAQHFTLSWFSLESGGTSTGGVYTISGTIGQPDTGKMSGGNFTLDGGFWGLIAPVQTPGAPYLSITLNPQLSTIAVSWPLSETRWQLQATTNLATSGCIWTACSYQTNGPNCVYIESPPLGTKFYRLKQ